MANVRFSFKNLADSGTLSASNITTGTDINNVKNNSKGSIFKALNNTVTINAAPPGMSYWTVGVVAFPICNLPLGATVTITLTNMGGQTTVKNMTINPGLNSNAPSGVAGFSYGGGSYAVAWFNNIALIQTISIAISAGLTTPLQLSRLFIGSYSELTVNPGLGMALGFESLTTQTRSEAGTVNISPGAVFKTLNFDLQRLSETERRLFLTMLASNGLETPMFVSVFPENTGTDREMDYTIYGFLSELSKITLVNCPNFATQISLKEF